MPAEVTAITPTGFVVETESGGTRYEYHVEIEDQRTLDEDGDVAERGSAYVDYRRVYEGHDVTRENDVDATKAVKDALDERGYDI